MSDIALIWGATALAADVAIVANDIASDDGLETSVLLSLYTDRRAEQGDALPDGETTRRGWWADSLADPPGDLFGSRLWLLARSKDTPDVLDRAEQYAREALQWLLDDRVAERVDVAAERLTTRSGFGLTVTIYRPALDPAQFRFGLAWAAQEARL